MSAQSRHSPSARSGGRSHCRSSLAGTSLLVIAALAAPLSLAAPAFAQSWSADGQLPSAGDLARSAREQIEAAGADFDAANIEATRDYIANLADNLKTTADGLKTLYDLRDAKPWSTSQADLSFFKNIAPTQDLLSGIDAEKADHYDLLQKLYDAADALRDDLQRTPAPHSNLAMVALSSDTFTKLGGVAIYLLASDKFLTPLVRDGMVSKSFRRYAGIISAGAGDLASAVKEISANGIRDPEGVSDLAKAATESAHAAISSGFLPRSVARPLAAWTLGADDVAAGVARGLASGNWRDPETASRLLDGINRSAWGAVGYLVSDGNPKVAQWFSDTADFTAKTVRAQTLQLSVDGTMSFGGYDQAIRDQFAATQNALAAHHQPLLTIEEYAHGDPTILRALGASAQEVAAARSLANSGAVPKVESPIEVVTRTTTESYRQVCQAGFCTRINLAAVAQPTEKVGGVRIHPDIQRVEGTTGNVGAIVRGGCAHSSGAACALR
jgi:hypothetical protein